MTEPYKEGTNAVLTADLGFGTPLAASMAAWPRVVQRRTTNTPPSYSGPLGRSALANSRCDIEVGALVTIRADRYRVRPLPIKSAD
jgi:hypothetical protein